MTVVPPAVRRQSSSASPHLETAATRRSPRASAPYRVAATSTDPRPAACRHELRAAAHPTIGSPGFPTDVEDVREREARRESPKARDEHGIPCFSHALCARVALCASRRVGSVASCCGWRARAVFLARVRWESSAAPGEGGNPRGRTVDRAVRRSPAVAGQQVSSMMSVGHARPGRLLLSASRMCPPGDRRRRGTGASCSLRAAIVHSPIPGGPIVDSSCSTQRPCPATPDQPAADRHCQRAPGTPTIDG